MCPITKSAKKALKQSKKRRGRNIQRQTIIKKLLKEIKKLVSEKKNEEAKKLLPQIYKLLDKAAKTGLIKKNTVARKKSRITKLIYKGAPEIRKANLG
jgi:small subunit ribosomal protein S20